MGSARAARGGSGNTRTWRGGRTPGGITAAAVVSQITDQALHCREIGRVGDAATLLLGIDQPGLLQCLEMERQGGSGDADRRRKITGTSALGTQFDEMTEDRQPGFLGERGQGIEGLLGLHVSMLLETWFQFHDRDAA